MNKQEHWDNIFLAGAGAGTSILVDILFKKVL